MLGWDEVVHFGTHLIDNEIFYDFCLSSAFASVTRMAIRRDRILKRLLIS